jgi:hypothetical protein
MLCLVWLCADLHLVTCVLLSLHQERCSLAAINEHNLHCFSCSVSGGCLQHVIELAAPAIVAWMDTQLRHKQPVRKAGPSTADVLAQMKQPASDIDTRHSMQDVQPELQPELQDLVGLQAFFRWVNREQLAGEITFEVKQETT